MLAHNPVDLLSLLVGHLEESRPQACRPPNCLRGDNRNYTFRRTQLLRIFDSLIADATSLVTERYGDAEAGRFIDDARRRFEQLLHRSAYLDGRQPLTHLLVLSTCTRAVYGAVQVRGDTLADARQLCSDIFDAKLRRMSLMDILHRLEFRNEISSTPVFDTIDSCSDGSPRRRVQQSQRRGLSENSSHNGSDQSNAALGATGGRNSP